MRLFVALWPPAAVQEALAAVRDHLIVHNAQLIPTHELHLTLAFLGERCESDAKRLAHALRSHSWPLGELTFSKVGYFAGPQVLWIGPDDASALSHVRAKLILILRQLDMPLEKASCFRAHVTLARAAQMPVPPLTLARVVRWTMQRPVLVHSTPQHRPRRYTLLE